MMSMYIELKEISEDVEVGYKRFRDLKGKVLPRDYERICAKFNTLMNEIDQVAKMCDEDV